MKIRLHCQCRVSAGEKLLPSSNTMAASSSKACSPRKEIAALQAEMESQFSKIPNCRGDFYGHETKRFSGAIVKSANSPQDRDRPGHPRGHGCVLAEKLLRIISSI